MQVVTWLELATHLLPFLLVLGSELLYMLISVIRRGGEVERQVLLLEAPRKASGGANAYQERQWL